MHCIHEASVRISFYNFSILSPSLSFLLSFFLFLEFELSFFDTGSEIVEGKEESKFCQAQKFPRGPKCNHPLLIMNKGKLTPQKVFYYKSLKEILCEKMVSPEFRKLTELWRTRTKTYDDVYDFNAWKKNEDFLKYPNNLGLMLHMDFLNPKGRTRKKYSVGVLYVSILNLPRRLRFKKREYTCTWNHPWTYRAETSPKQLHGINYPRFVGLRPGGAGHRRQSKTSSI